MVFPWVPAIAMHFPLLTTKPSSSALFTEVNLFPLNSVNKLLEAGIAGVYTINVFSLFKNLELTLSNES